MLRISEMELLGFKSFCEKVQLSFEGGVTAVVGPNGCGKSNISDALSWVLGEQSAKSLRGTRMEDVIFNGSVERKPVGMAEVTLKFLAPSTREDAAEGEQDELLVSRRLFRDGESEYAMNGKRCRLMDIEERLLGYGVSGKAYSIIEQGKIGMILSGRASDRRILIEEAASVHHYKAKKHQAELRLEAAAVNLERLDDIIGEVRRQLGSLKRQASKAERFRELRASQRHIDRIVILRSFRKRSEEEQALKGRSAAATEALARDLSLLTSAEADLEAMRAERLQRERELAAARETLHEVRLHVERQEAAARQADAEKSDLTARCQAAWESVVEAERKFEEMQAVCSARRVEVELRAAAVAEKQEALATAQEATRRLLERAAEEEAALETHKDRTFGAANGLAAVRNGLQKLSALSEKAKASQAKNEMELHGISLERDRLREAAMALLVQSQTHADALKGLGEEIASLESEEGRLQSLRSVAERSREESRSARDQAGHRLGSLQEVEDRRLSYEEGVRMFFERHPELASLAFGIVADHLQVPQRFEAAMESFLGEALQWVIVPDVATARASARALAEVGIGRVGFLPLAGLPEKAASATLSSDAILSSIVDLVRVSPEAPHCLADRLKTTLPAAFVVEELDQALDLGGRHAELSFVTLAGEVLRAGGALIVGRRGGPGILAVKREIRELTARMEALEADAARCDEELARVQQALVDLDRRRRSAEEAQRTTEREHLTRLHEGEQIAQSLARLDSRQGVIEMELSEVKRELASYLEERDQLAIVESEKSVELEGLQEERGRLAQSLHDTREQLPDARAAEDRAARELSIAREERAKTEAELSSLEARLAELSERSRSLGEEIERMEGRVAALAEALTVAGDKLGELAKAQEEAATGVRDRSEAYEDLGMREGALGSELKERRNAYDQTREVTSQLDVERAQVEAEIRHLSERCLETLHVRIDDVEGTLTEQEEEEPLEALTAEAQRLSERIDGLGPVNLMAIEEAKELEERADFLTRQREDVHKSIEDIRATIKKINETSRERFLEAFSAISDNFQRTFKELFGGGHAELRISGDEDVLEGGVEVIAQPPGKRLQNLMLLSGGEKALSALALLFAIFQYRPSPFCVLDEVDAPLDEANVGRFTSLLEKMQDSTQFILITHNKSTMEIAERLYGISMDEPGVSKVYSVKLGHDSDHGNGNGKGNNGKGQGQGERGKRVRPKLVAPPPEPVLQG